MMIYYFWITKVYCFWTLKKPDLNINSEGIIIIEYRALILLSNNGHSHVPRTVDYYTNIIHDLIAEIAFEFIESKWACSLQTYLY